jgi:hypothetical protein
MGKNELNQLDASDVGFTCSHNSRSSCSHLDRLRRKAIAEKHQRSAMITHPTSQNEIAMVAILNRFVVCSAVNNKRPIDFFKRLRAFALSCCEVLNSIVNFLCWRNFVGNLHVNGSSGFRFTSEPFRAAPLPARCSPKSILLVDNNKMRLDAEIAWLLRDSVADLFEGYTTGRSESSRTFVQNIFRKLNGVSTSQYCSPALRNRIGRSYAL